MRFPSLHKLHAQKYKTSLSHRFMQCSGKPGRWVIFHIPFCAVSAANTVSGQFEAATGYGTGAGLCGWNCRHTFFAIFPELGAPPAWTQESLEKLDARDIEYSGKKYTQYEISQMQRARERTVRKYKRRYLAEDAAGADTTVHNAIRDGAEWAWVPHGDACPFCRMLASNGWQKASKKLLKKGHAQHIHSNCDCEFAVRFSREFDVSGYDPEKYLRQYRAAGSDVNALRRIDYAARKDVINAQKRAAYAAQKGSTESGKSATIGLDNDRYTIAEPKISKFLLKPGAKHSAEFFAVGYSEQDAMKLNADIYQQFDEALKTDVRIADDGTESFSIFMELGTAEKKTFRTVWQRDVGSEKPRLITAHREGMKK